MKNILIAGVIASFMGFSSLSIADTQSKQAQATIEKLNAQGVGYRDAYAQLSYEIAYETASVQAKQPCRKMTRGL
ncbi:hypothetical protein [Thiomicrorhabdus aquaedulcis]|uniref:hypothetical protein n=1 Tax=Thiomicrorhabdus aquaedulcis TaxID=2211106 RepID=UPI000FD8DB6F|nr:hypothetical protein [Thiomicrorhabdus aquaedulcis]